MGAEVDRLPSPAPVRWIWVLPLLAAGGLTAAGLAGWPPSRSRTVRTPTGAGFEPPAPPQAGGAAQGLVGPHSADEGWLVQPGDRPYGGEPAGLTPPPTAQAQRWGGVERQSSGTLERIVSWRLEGIGLADAAAHYAAEARAAGFDPLRAAASTPNVRGVWSHAYVRRNEAERRETLIVRLAPAGDDAVRALLWLRYAMPAADDR